MKDDKSLEEDLKLMSYEKSKLLDDLSYLKLPIKINTKFLKDSSILLNGQYDNYLKLWFGDHKWRLIYRASEHGYSAHSFHDYCDNKGPTIVIKKRVQEAESLEVIQLNLVVGFVYYFLVDY